MRFPNKNIKQTPVQTSMALIYDVAGMIDWIPLTWKNMQIKQTNESKSLVLNALGSIQNASQETIIRRHDGIYTWCMKGFKFRWNNIFDFKQEYTPKKKKKNKHFFQQDFY